MLIARIKNVQSMLYQVGFRKTSMTGEMEPPKEALAIFQIRRGLTVNGELTEENHNRLIAELPNQHDCEDAAG
ncbi:MAG: hypothetical protein CMQ05_06730 [Gammaproteobacteria bacterium]|nr:hypothetical protein [Gammaproteobacteria bacterium]